MTAEWNRRHVLAASGALACGSVMGAAVSPPTRASATPDQGTAVWEPVPAADLESLTPDLFDDDELTLPYFLAHLHTVANAVVEDGPLRGFIDIHVWRGSAEQFPDHARVMENTLSFAYFWATDRPWNLHHHSPALHDRLRASLEYLIGLQDDNGMYPFDGGSDFGGDYKSLSYANTAFATKFLGETLTILEADAAFDTELYADLSAAQRKSLHYLLTDTAWYEFVAQYSNQYTNVWAGATAYLHLDPDPEIQQLLVSRMAESPGHFQSPVGFMYEGHGVDWRYTLSTHLSNVRSARHYAELIPDGVEIISLLDDELAAWTEFLSLNAVPEPDGGFVLNRAIETRQAMSYLDRVPEPGARDVETARAFAPSTTEIQTLHDRQRNELEARWPEVDELVIGGFNAYTPYQFLHLSNSRWYPSDEQRDESLQQLPCLASNNFTQQRTDSRGPMTHTFIRRGNYYAVFNSGQRTRGGQRLGLGLLWNDALGAVTQTQSRHTEDGVWGTRTADVSYENAAELLPQFFVGDTEIEPTPGIIDLPLGELTIVHPLGDRGTKRIRFLDDQILIDVEHTGPFMEDIPLLHDPSVDVIDETGDQISLRHNDLQLTITTSDASDISVLPSDVQIWDDPPPTTTILPAETVNLRAGDETVGAKMLATARITAEDRLVYRVRFPRSV